MPVDEGFLDILLTRWNPAELAEHLRTLCPECGKQALDDSGSELVCRSCGLVVEEQIQLVKRLPFDTTYALEASVAYGRSLGGTLQSKDLHRIVSQNKVNLKDLGASRSVIENIANMLNREGRKLTLPEAKELLSSYINQIRLVHLRTHVEVVEPPQLLKLKAEISDLLKKYGLYGHDYNEFNHQLANQIGMLAHKAAQFPLWGRTRPLSSYRKLAAAIIAHVTGGYPRLNGLSEKIVAEEDPHDYDLGAIKCLVSCPLLRSPEMKV